MSANRWKNLDFDPPDRGSTTPQTKERATEVPALPCVATPVQEKAEGAPSQSLVSTQAQGAYLLRNYQAVVDLLEPALHSEPDLAGGARILGLALAQLDREAEAVERLLKAIQQSSADWLARASLASLLLGRQDVREAPTPLDLLDEALRLAPEAARPAVRELLGAAFWRAGQRELAQGVPRAAARAFAASASSFREAALVSGAARLALSHRLAAALVGEAVALLLAGELEAAQRLFSRAPMPAASEGGPLDRFAAALYELCEELGNVTTAEREAVTAELRQAVLQTRLEVALFDGRRAVGLAWVGDL